MRVYHVVEWYADPYITIANDYGVFSTARTADSIFKTVAEKIFKKSYTEITERIHNFDNGYSISERISDHGVTVKWYDVDTVLKQP